MRERSTERAGAVICVAGMILILATCDASTLVEPPGTERIAFDYRGDTVMALGRTVEPAIDVTVNDQPLANPRLILSSSDSSIVDITSNGLLQLKGLGTASLVVSLRSSVLPAAPPSLERRIHVVAESLSVSTSAVSLSAIGATALVAGSAWDFNGVEIIDAPLHWESSDPARAVVNQRGVITAKGSGAVQIRAMLGPDTALVAVDVTQALARYTISQQDVTFDAFGSTFELSVVAKDANGNIIPPGPGAAPVWASRDQSIADVSTTGTVTARRNASTWIAAQRGVVADSARITINQLTTQVVILSVTGFSIDAINQVLPLTALAFDRNSHPDVGAVAAWSSLDPTVAQVDAVSGVVVGRAVGSARIVAAIEAGADTVWVNVANAPTRLELTPPSVLMTSVMDIAQLSAVAYNSIGGIVPAEITWRSTDTTIVVVLTGSRIEARGVGTARIIAQAGTMVDTTIVVVTNDPAAINIQPTTVDLTYVSEVVSPAATIRNARGDDLPRSAVTWTTADAAIATVSTAGAVTARQVGATWIRAAFGTVIDSVRVTVTNVPYSIALSGQRDTITAVGRSIGYSADVRNQVGVVIPGASVVWRSTNSGVAGVSQSGIATATGFGTAMIIGQASAVEDTVIIVVTNPTVLFVDNSVIVTERFGTRARPYLRIQDAVQVADAGDTVFVARGFGYSESFGLPRRITLLGDSAAFVAGGRTNAALLPAIRHDTGTAGISATTTAPIVIRYFSLTHSLDGPAIDIANADVWIEYFFVNPGTSPVKLGRGIRIRSAPTFAVLADVNVRNVRGYGIRLETVTQGQVDRAVIQGVDSIAGTRGAGIDVYKGSGNDIRTTTVREAQGPSILLDSTSNASVVSNTLAGRSVLTRVRAASGLITVIESNQFDLTVLPGATDTRGSSNDGRSGLEIVSSSNVQVRDNLFRETGTSLMDGVRLITSRGGGAFGAVTLFRNRFEGGRHSVRSERSSWTMTESRSEGAVLPILATDIDSLQLNNDTLTLTQSDACLSSTGGSARVDIIGGLFSRCGNGTVGGSALRMTGSSANLTVRNATLGGPNQTAIDFNGRDLTVRNNTISGAGTRTVTGFVASGAIDAVTSQTSTVSGNVITDYPTLIGVLLDARTIVIDSNLVARNSTGLSISNWFSAGATAIDNDLYDNTFAGLLIPASKTMSVPGNWWGDARGPRRTAAPAAVGDSVSTTVTVGTVRATPFYPGTTAASIRAVRGSGQTATRGTALPRAFTARVVDQNGRPVAGASVTFTVLSGGGSLAGSTSRTVTTDASGLAETTLTLGATSGANSVDAAVSGASGSPTTITFTATGS